MTVCVIQCFLTLILFLIRERNFLDMVCRIHNIPAAYSRHVVSSPPKYIKAYEQLNNLDKDRSFC